MINLIIRLAPCRWVRTHTYVALLLLVLGQGYVWATPTVETEDPTVSTPASSEQPDSLELHNGGFLRGTLLEYLPGSHVIIRSSADQPPRRFEIAQIKSIQRNGKELPLHHQLKRRTELERVWDTLDGPRLTLSASADRSAMLQRRIGNTSSSDRAAYYIVCELPCIVKPPRSDPALYRVGGDQLQPTPWFSLPSVDANLRATMVRESTRMWPKALLLLGGVVSLLGTTVFVLHTTDVLKGDGWRWASVGMTGLTVSLAGTGIGLWLWGPQSRAAIDLR